MTLLSLIIFALAFCSVEVDSLEPLAILHPSQAVWNAGTPMRVSVDFDGGITESYLRVTKRTLNVSAGKWVFR